MKTKIAIWLAYSGVIFATMALVWFGAHKDGRACIWCAIAIVFCLIVGHIETKALEAWRARNERYWSVTYRL